jgi:putative spermidine/putrescine transport system permease protein
VIAIALFYLFARLGLVASNIGITIGHTVVAMPVVFMVMLATFKGYDWKLDAAASTLGADRLRIFWRITLPLIGPGILGGALLAFTLSFDDFVIAFFVTGPGASTLPIEIYAMVKRGVTPEINAVASLILLVSGVLIVLSQRLQKSG